MVGGFGSSSLAYVPLQLHLHTQTGEMAGYKLTKHEKLKKKLIQYFTFLSL